MKNFNNPFKLNKKLVYILGGNGLIGTEVSILLANLGAKIIIIDKKTNLLTKSYKNIKFEKFDISNISKLKSFFKKSIKKHGVPNIFVNCSRDTKKD